MIIWPSETLRGSASAKTEARNNYQEGPPAGRCHSIAPTPVGSVVVTQCSKEAVHSQDKEATRWRDYLTSEQVHREICINCALLWFGAPNRSTANLLLSCSCRVACLPMFFNRVCNLCLIFCWLIRSA